MNEHPDCPRALEQLQDWLRREVTPEAAAELEAHLRACAPCRAQAEFEERFRAVLERCTGDDGCPPETRTRLLEALRREQQR
jgi:anti-sigma factor (TIGR02949 family)